MIGTRGKWWMQTVHLLHGQLARFAVMFFSLLLVGPAAPPSQTVHGPSDIDAGGAPMREVVPGVYAPREPDAGSRLGGHSRPLSFERRFATVPLIEGHARPWPTTREATVAQAQDGCSLLFQHALPLDVFTYFFDVDRGLSYLFVPGYLTGWFDDPMLRYEIDARLDCTVTELPIPVAHPWLAIDLDLDGQIELVVQRGSIFTGDGTLDIHSAPDWRMRAQFLFPGMNVAMHAVAVNIDDDPYLELYFTPSTFGGTARAVLADYDPVRDTFVVIADIPAPFRTFGNPAVGDFDEDGRMEFISGNERDGGGYGLFEYDGDSLRFIDQIFRDSVPGLNWSAVACRPEPDGILYALLGSSGLDAVYRAWLLKPIGDNQFQIVRSFAQYGGGAGDHDVFAADIDCNGLDELLINLPYTETWEWDESLGDFVPGCLQPGVVPGGLLQVAATDLNQNGALEWTGIRGLNPLMSFEDPRCGLCCPCHGDPLCDSIVTDVRDVVACIAVVIRGTPPTFDPACPRERTDVDCSGITDILDIVHTVAVAFGSASRAAEFCAKPSCNAAH